LCVTADRSRRLVKVDRGLALSTRRSACSMPVSRPAETSPPALLDRQCRIRGVAAVGSRPALASLLSLSAASRDVCIAVGAGRDADRPALRPPTRPARILSRARYARVGRIARRQRPLTARLAGRTALVASDHQRARSGLNARRTPTPPRPDRLHCRPFRRAATPLVVRSFAPPSTILHGAVITILRVRQHCERDVG
jgi:hypothetical protein